jgi:hypothetical protein
LNLADHLLEGFEFLLQLVRIVADLVEGLAQFLA